MKRYVLPTSLLVVLTVAGCGGGTKTAGRSTSSRLTTPGRATAPSTHPPTAPVTTTGPISSTTAQAGSIPAGFAPRSFTAVSDNDYWVLGDAPCDSGRCTVIARTSDGGASFTRLTAPELQGVGAAGVTPTLRFADRSDGWAFVTGAGGAFYSTHDGGSHWRQLQLGSLVAFASGGGYAYAVTADCSQEGCSDFHFRRSPISRDAWSQDPMPFTPDGPVLDLTAHGTDVWLLGTRAGQDSAPHDLLAHSTNAGQTFSVADGPCYAGLGGELEPSSSSVLWTVCPTGMLAGASRSTDGGRTFTPLHTRPLANSAKLAPTSDAAALLAPDGAAGPPLLTRDAGSTWTRANTPPGATFWSWVGFTDARVGAALVQIQVSADGSGETQHLWRTNDGGATWHDVSFR